MTLNLNNCQHLAQTGCTTQHE